MPVTWCWVEAMILSNHPGMRSEPVRTARVWQALDFLNTASSHNAFVRKSWSDTPVQAFAASVVKTWTPPRAAGEADEQAEAGQADAALPLEAELSPEETAAATLALTEEALEAERKAAYAEGLAEGQRQVREEWNAEKHKNRTSSESIMIELDVAVRRVIDTPDKLYEPLKRLALHLAEQLVLAELTVSPQAIERLVRRSVDELAPQRQAPITVELNPADLAVLQAPPPAANGQTPANAEGAADKPAAPQWPWHLQANDDLLPGSVRASASDAVVSDLIENRLEVLARGLLLDSNRGMAQSAFQPSRMAARMANDREVVDAQPRMTPAPAPTRSFGTSVMEDMNEAQDMDEASSFAPASLAERDVAAMDLPDLNLDDLDAQGDWNSAAAGPDADAEPDNFLPPDADTSDV
jgi:flagellar biosynthesis/type III secretory pathway protein FliH